VLTGSAPATSTRRTTTGTTTTRPPTITSPVAPATGAGASALEAAGFLQFAEGVRVIPDARTNALLVMATKEDMARLETLIKNVDSAVAQVLIEVVIGEVKLTGELDMGVDIIKRLFTEHDVRMYGGTKTGPSGSPTPVDLTTVATAPLASALTYYATFKELKLDAVMRLLQTSNRFKVLSTPIIQTLHNQEASIIVGESRPVATSTLSDVVGGSGSNTTTSLRSNIEFKDIAIELKVTPRINPDGMVTVEVDQKVNEAGEEKDVGGVRVPVITKREAKSTVTVKDQSTSVLGGLIKEGKTLSESKVPFLGDIPLIGLAFRDKSVKKERTELIVFIRPTVLRTSAEAQAEAKRRSELLKAGEELRLHEKFPAEEPATNASPTSATEPAAGDRHAAKVRALSGSKP
jgi:general secretion pathway protein D